MSPIEVMPLPIRNADAVRQISAPLIGRLIAAAAGAGAGEGVGAAQSTSEREGHRLSCAQLLSYDMRIATPNFHARRSSTGR
jgi:hypothetical protein